MRDASGIVCGPLTVDREKRGHERPAPDRSALSSLGDRVPVKDVC